MAANGSARNDATGSEASALWTLQYERPVRSGPAPETFRDMDVAEGAPQGRVHGVFRSGSGPGGRDANGTKRARVAAQSRCRGTASAGCGNYAAAQIAQDAPMY